MFFTPDPTSAAVQKSLQTNKQRRLMQRKLWFSAMTRIQSGRREQLHSVCPELFFVEMEAEHLPKAEVPSVYLFTHLHIGFLEYQHLFQVEFKCLRVSSVCWCVFIFMTRRYKYFSNCD